MKRLSIPMLLSILGHVVLVLILSGVIRLTDSGENLPLAGSGGGGSVFVDIVGDGGESGKRKDVEQTVQKNKNSTSSFKYSKKSGSPSMRMAGPGTGPGGTGVGSGPSGGTNPILADIRARIERAKRYPLLLRQSGVQGVSRVSFRINAQGQPESISLQASSGSPALDEEALATIRRAAPYPLYNDALTIGIRFELKN